MSRNSSKPGDSDATAGVRSPGGDLQYVDAQSVQIPSADRQSSQLASQFPQFAGQSGSLTYTQPYPPAFNLGTMAASLPDSSEQQGRHHSYPYPPYLQTQPTPYYPFYPGGPGLQPRSGFASHAPSPHHQQQWIQSSGSPHYGPVGYGYPPPPQYSPSFGSPGMFSVQNQQSTIQHGQYRGNSRQDYSPTAPGSYATGLTTSGPQTNPSVQTLPRGPPRKPRQSGHALWVGNLPPAVTVMHLKEHFSFGAKNDIESVKLISKSNCAFVNYRSQDACAAAMERFHDSKLLGTRLVCRLRRTLPVPPSSPTTLEPPSQATLGGSEASDDSATSPSTSWVTGTDPSPRRRLKDRFFVLKSLTLQDLEMSTRTGKWATQAHNEEILNDAFEHADNVYLFFSANKSGEYFGYARMASSISSSGERINVVEVPEDDETPNDPRKFDASTPFIPVPTEASPRAIITWETQSAPKGRIIDDQARGTIFWEADEEKLEEEARESAANHHLDSSSQTSPTRPEASPAAGNAKIVSSKPDSEEETEKKSKIEVNPGEPVQNLRSPAIASSASGTPDPSSSSVRRGSSELPSSPLENAQYSSPGSGNTFRIDWLMIRKLPFYRCRGLRNPWNANREVKIARDGTEIETSVGLRLMALFRGP